MRLSNGTDQAFFTLVLSSGWSPSVGAFICFKDLVNVATIFSVEALFCPPFYQAVQE